MAHRVAQRAGADLDDIWYYVATESGSISVANRLIDSIAGRFLLLSDRPYLGRARDDDFGPAHEALRLANSSSCITLQRVMC